MAWRQAGRPANRCAEPDRAIVDAVTSNQGLFLDFDGTLLDGSGNEEAVMRTCVEIAASHPGLDADRLYEANVESWRGYWPEVQRRWPTGDVNGATVALETWSRSLRSCGYLTAPLAHEAADRYRHHWRETLRLYSDARELLALAQRTHVHLALITNGASDTQRDALRTLGIERAFEVVVISGEVGVAKPDPAIFGIALEKLNLTPENVWHVGDNLTTDVAGAKAAGLRSAWLNRDEHPLTDSDPEPTQQIRSLTEVAALLRID